MRQLTGQRRLDLAAVLAQGRLDPRQTQPRRKRPPRCRGELLTRLDLEQPVLGQLEAGAHRDLAERMLCGFEPVKYISAAPHTAGSTTRRSTCTPLVVTIEDFVGPCARTRATSGSAQKARITSIGLAPT